MLHFIVIAAFILHGLAHASGFMASWTRNSSGFSDRPWVLSTGVTLHSIKSSLRVTTINPL